MVGRPEDVAPKALIEIEQAEKGNIIRYERVTPDGVREAGVEILEGTQGSQNLNDRTRRLTHSLIQDWFPVAEPASNGAA